MDLVRVGFVLHVMQVAGAEVLVAETIRRLRGKIDPAVLCLDDVGVIGERLRQEGVPVIELHRKPGLDLAVPRRMASVVNRLALDVLHAHQYTPFFYSALSKPLLKRRTHLMFTEHGRHFPDTVSSKRRLINRYVLSRCADEINGVSQFSVDSLARIDGFDGQPMTVIPNGIDLWRYGQGTQSEAQVRIGLDPWRRYIACVARFHPIKDHAMLLRAFARTARAVADVDLLLAGDGPLRPELEAQTRALGLDDRVRFLGVRSDVPDVLLAADVFALTSIAEAASITLLEAMATGVPVVVTNVGGNPELVQDGVQGVLVPRGDAEATAEAFVSLLTDQVRARQLGSAGRQRVEKHYQLDTTIQAYYDRYIAAALRVRSIRTEKGAAA